MIKLPAVGPTLFMTVGYWILNVRTHLGACRTHAKRGVMNKHVCTKVDSEGEKNKQTQGQGHEEKWPNVVESAMLIACLVAESIQR